MSGERPISLPPWRRLRPASVHLRLTLWNVAGLALLLLALGVTLRYTLQASLKWMTDEHLTLDARGIQEDFAQFSPPPAGTRRPDFRHGPPFGRHRHAGSADGPLPPRMLGLDRRALPPFPYGGVWDPDTVSLSTRGRAVYSDIRVADGPARVLSVPLWRGGRIVGVVQVGARTAAAEQEVSRLTHVLLTLTPLALLLAALGGALLTGRTLQPVRQITRAAAHIEASDLSERLPVTGEDEFALLASTFNGMLGRLEEAFTQLSRANRDLTLAYERQRRFTADASHELRTPLTVIKANTSLALEEARTEAEYRQALEAVDQAVDRSTRLIQDLLQLARSDAGHLRLKMARVDIRDVLHQAWEAAGAPERPEVSLPPLPGPPLDVWGHCDALVGLFSNLLVNAVRHTPADGLVVLSAEAWAGQVRVRVGDTGAGIPPEHLPHLFERFYRVDESRSGESGGTGLGLAICRSIAEAHGGGIEIESVVGSGTTVMVTLPGVERAGAADAAPALETRHDDALTALSARTPAHPRRSARGRPSSRGRTG